jgi:orotidine 5'-phosphate decarboxylase subfamily 1/orotate phosphoribosyltransferase
MLNPSVSYKLKSKIEKIRKKKNSNVIVSLDLTNPEDIIGMIDDLGWDALGFKLHSDIIEFDKIYSSYSDRWSFYSRIIEMREEMNFIIIEDRKFSDIGNTVKLQSNLITPYADLITVHSLPGESILEGLKENCIVNECGILLIGQMSCDGNLITNSYTEETVNMAFKYSDVVVGFICQEKLTTSSDFLNFSPGVKLEDSNDSLGQVYNTPKTLLGKGTDIFIVGRGIYESSDPYKAFHDYNDACMPDTKESRNPPFNSLDNSFDESNTSLRELIINNNILKKGSFMLSSGETSPIYADFRLLTGIAPLMKKVAKEFTDIILRTNRDISDVVLMGVPLGGIALASAVSMDSEIGMVVVRDKRKTYGSKNLIEGMNIDTLRKKHIILIEDVITTGGSVESLIQKLKEEEQIEIKQAICILDRNKGGMKMLKDKYDLQVDTIFSLEDFI